MARYRKKLVVIEAIQWDGLNLEEIRRFVGSSLVYHIFDAAWKAGECQPVVDMKIKTLEGEMQVGKGDYIIKGVHGEFYPCKPNIFKETYELANIADVVPKSEVDRLNAVMKEMDEQRAYTINMLVESLEKAKAEIAREIFAEIDALFVRFYDDPSYSSGELGYDIAELKKKYTEENT